MKDRPRPLIYPYRSFGVSTLGRWVLILLLAFDLTSSPFHAHAHDLGPDGLVSHALHAADSLDGPEQVHVEADDVRRFGHSLVALLPVELQPGPWQPGVQVTVNAPPPTSDPSSPVTIHTEWRAALERIPISRHAYLRPDSRAPPPLRT